MSTKRTATLSWLVAVAVAVTTAVTAPVAHAATDIATTDTAVEATSAPAAPSALSGSQFNPGLIISDAQFFDNDALTQAQIQSFLVSKVGYCSNSNCLANLKTTSTSRSADSWCSAITGSSNESAASVIYKVQRACGVSAKVILVTLQKEQGLITDHAPTSGELRIAMGYGCPDTSACDSLYYGFFNQIYNAARQFQRYGGPGLNWYPVGQVSAIRYHPNAACGAKNVLIQNRATAALYYYTPYTPNAAALANLGGTGNSCSSYGNRNFWYFYNTWFAATVAEATAAINEKYSSLGGASGELGAAIGAVACVNGVFSCSQRFAGGLIYWTSAAGAFAVTGDLGDYYLSIGGPSSKVGAPLKDVQIVEDSNGNGRAQQFEGGWIHAGPPGIFASTTKIMTAYSEAGWLRAELGWPTSEEACGPAGTACIQTFEGGQIVATSPTDSTVFHEDIAALWNSTGGASGPLGHPMSASTPVTDPNGNGFAQKFQRGWIHSSSAGTFASSAAIMTAYSEAGWLRGELGWPVSKESCGPAGSSCIQQFANGYLLVPAGKEGGRMQAAVADEYKAKGGPTGWLGYPLALTQVVTDPNGNGFAQKFQHGWIHSSDAGTFASSSAIMSVYSDWGWLRGELGWPTSAESCSSGTCSQTFEGGRIVASASGGRVVPSVSNAEIKALYDSLGGESGALGYALAGTQTVTDANGNGFAQKFQGGWIHSSDAGTYASSSGIMTAYSSAGWLRGFLGWPTAAETCSGGTCSQQFAGGQIVTSAAGRAVAPSITNAEIRALYDSLGGPNGWLGYPLAMTQTVADRNGNGFAQKFEGGWIHSSEAGTFATGTSLMLKYSAAGWLRGYLGWPTASQQCTPTACSQSFVGGELRTDLTGAPAVSNASIRAVYDAAGGAGGALGAPVKMTQTVVDPNGNGFAQAFEGGWIHSSARGTFVTGAKLMPAYSAARWIRGSLGWPVDVEVCSAIGCTQTFAGGVLAVK